MKPDDLADVIRQAPTSASGEESCGSFDIRIARDGTWYYRGTPINRIALCRLFSTVLRREPDGSYWLVTPVERGSIVVDDAPFTAVEMTIQGAGEGQQLRFRTNLDQELVAGPDHPLRVDIDEETGEPSPYVLVRDNLEALIVRAVYYDLVDLAVERETEDGRVLGIWSGGSFFPLGPATD